MSKVTNIFFSPSGTTKKVLDQIASNFDEENQICDLLYFDGEKEFASDDVVIVGMPVFAGRIPKTARSRLSKLTGDNTKAIAVVNYGNAHVTDALIELVDLLNENNFDVIAAASTISHHSIFDGVAVGRPDEEDIEYFAKREHEGWLKLKLNLGYAHLPIDESDIQKIEEGIRESHNPNLVSWKDLDINVKKANKDTFINLPKLCEDPNVALKIVRRQ